MGGVWKALSVDLGYASDRAWSPPAFRVCSELGAVGDPYGPAVLKSGSAPGPPLSATTTQEAGVNPTLSLCASLEGIWSREGRQVS